MKKVSVRVKMYPGCEDLFPAKAHADDAAFDLKSRLDTVLKPGRSQIVPSGVFIELPVNYEAQIRPRSGLAAKFDLMLTNSPGTVDAGYRGEIGIIMYNGGRNDFEIKRGDRIAQMVITELPEVELLDSENLSESKRGSGGFGSTGV